MRRPASTVPSRTTDVLLLLLALQSVRVCDAFWSYLGGRTDDRENAEPEGVLVSPIVNRELKVSVKAHDWPTTESNVVCEAWALLQPQWAFLDAWIDDIAGSAPSSRTSSSSCRKVADRVVRVATRTQATSNPELLEYSLLMRSKSPACQLSRTLALQTIHQLSLHDVDGPFAVVHPHGKLATSPDDLLELLACNTQDECRDSDTEQLLLPGESPRPSQLVGLNGNSASIHSDNGLVILYGDMTSTSFVEFYRKLAEMDAPFVVRYFSDHSNGANSDHTSPSTSTTLQGFGVRLDIRNVEYKVFDDHKRPAADDEESQVKPVNASALNALSEHFLAGVNLTALFGDSIDADPINETLALQSELWKLHDEQTSHAGLIPPAWQRRQLSAQAAYVLIQSAEARQQNTRSSASDPLNTLEEISQNLPSVASTLVHIKLPEEFEGFVKDMDQPLHQLIRQSRGGLWINGRAVAIERPSFNVFEMIDLLLEEEMNLLPFHDSIGELFNDDVRDDVIQTVYNAWIQGSDFFDDTNGDDGDNNTGDNGLPSAKPSYRIDVGRGWKQSIFYLNDIEKDAQYSSWPRSMQQMLMAMQYGMAPSVRRNVFTALAVLDPSRLLGDGVGRPIALDLAFQLMQSQFPLRLGVLIVDQDDVDACQKWVQDTRPDDGAPCPLGARNLFGGDPATMPTVEDLDDIKSSARIVHRLLASTMERLEREKHILYHEHLITISAQAVQQRIKSGMDPILTAANLFNVHRRVLSSLGEAAPTIAEILQQTIDSENASQHSSSAHLYGRAVRFAADKGLRTGMSFLNGLPLPLYDDDDAQEKIGQIFMEEQQTVFGMVARGEIGDTSPRSIYGKLLSGRNVYPKIHRLFVDSDNPSNFVQLKLKDPSKLGSLTVVHECDHTAATFAVIVVIADETDNKTYKAMASDEILSMYSEGDECTMTVGYSIVHRSDLVLQGHEDVPSSNFLWVNGRIYDLQGEAILKDDLEILTSMEQSKANAVAQLLEPYTKFMETQATIAAIASVVSFLSSATVDRQDVLRTISHGVSGLGLTENPLQIDFPTSHNESNRLRTHVVAVVDPVSKTAQRMAPLLTAIRDQLRLPLTVILAPTAILDGDSKIPISSYYRFVASPWAYQDSEEGPVAHFSNLPPDHVFTIQLDVPEPWNVQQTRTVQDTDNLRCDLSLGCSDAEHLGFSPYSSSVPTKYHHITEVEYGLSSLMFFGQCYEVQGKMSPPNGLQLTLSPNTALGIPRTDNDTQVPRYSDTLVMKTLGYWQLRSNPGIWNLNILEESRGVEIFDMIRGTISRGMLKLAKGEDVLYRSKRLIMDSFVSKSQTLLVRRKKGYERASLFYESGKPSHDDKKDDVVNVFSLATGHLYERFLKIMMLSVTKRTSSKVKFWLFENFLSPNFKASARAMAERIGCEVEFVTYKWPEFLRGQTEKQRIIWGYKILFLDVLFPLDVKKIIYVDADQVVRGDLKELWDMDLQGAAYGYTPMCSSRESTKGYQFWNTGFWQSHLRGKPYHISALYVVDLELFRKKLVGDQLRSVYQQLSADPNSLANLDQDLPNYAQHQVPIFSLPQEWLWCESWCSDETKAASKTIDLCNNPLHKEAKVSMAKRIISGELFNESWVELDEEVDGYYRDFLQHSANGIN